MFIERLNNEQLKVNQEKILKLFLNVKPLVNLNEV